MPRSLRSIDPDREPIEFRDRDGKVFWRSHVGPQTRALVCDADEILYGGARGGGKSACLIAWLTLGNPDLPVDHPCHFSYLNHPRYRALVLRRDATDLKEFVSEATYFFKNFGLVGGKKTSDPPEFHFQTGAIIYTNHLKSEDAFEKYKGANLHKLGVEELTLIEAQNSYLRVLGSLRSVYPEIRTQTFATTNPDGNGSPWVRKRFVYVQGVNGKMIPWGTKMLDGVVYRATGVKKTRVFIPAKLKDNPSLGPEYLANLMLQDEKTQRAWIDGDWDTQSGQYFSTFRPHGPHFGEPETARHVIKTGSVMLQPWWPRYIGMDWGFKDNAAAEWLCNNQEDGRDHVYREVVRNRVGAESLGVLVGQESLGDLIGQPDLSIPLYLSHDAFREQDVSKTTAELIQKGVETVLGAGSAVLTASKVSEREEAAANSVDAVEISPEFESDAKIIIHRAGKERVGVWQHLRSKLRFKPMIELGQPNPEYVKKLLDQPDGMVRYEKYLASFVQKEEILPAILFWDCCPYLIEDLSSAIHDDKKPEDILEKRQGASHMDPLNALRHILQFLQKRANLLPRREFLSQRMNMVQYDDATILAQVARKAESDYTKLAGTGAGTFRLPRASMRNRVM